MTIIQHIAMSPNGVFFGSTLVLFLALLLNIRNNVLRLSFLDKVNIASIEFRHPYLPSLKKIMAIGFCVAALLLVSLKMFDSEVMKADRNIWLYLGVIFVDACAVLIITEIKKKYASDFAFAFVTSSSLCFIGFLLLTSAGHIPMPIALFLLLLLLTCVVIAWQIFDRTWSRKTQITSLVTIVCWLVVFGMVQ
ncbi:MAG: hypothetical protein JWM56_599 [Candidatus Peribacteria bacterium]|nr:hypothetical protein [Candidatus Peribacteria bacterium]